MMKLQPYHFTVTHKPGQKHSNIDALSRLEILIHSLQFWRNELDHYQNLLEYLEIEEFSLDFTDFEK